MGSDTQSRSELGRRFPESDSIPPGHTDRMAELGEFYRSRRSQLFYNALALVHDHSAAEDLTQDTFLRLLSEMKQGNSVRSPLHWTNVVLRNLVLNYIEHARVVSRVMPGDTVVNEEIIPDGALSIEEKLIEKRRHGALHQALNLLSPVDRECILMFGEGSSFQEIARAKQLSYGVAVARIRQALRRIRAELTGTAGMSH